MRENACKGAGGGETGRETERGQRRKEAAERGSESWKDRASEKETGKAAERERPGGRRRVEQKRTKRDPKGDRERTEEQRAKEFRERVAAETGFGSRGRDEVREEGEDAERDTEQR